MYIWVFTLLNTEMVESGTAEAKVPLVEMELVQLLMEVYTCLRRKCMFS